MNIALLIKTDKSVQEMDQNWKPEIIGSKEQVITVLEALLKTQPIKVSKNNSMVDRFIYESKASYIEFDLEEQKEIDSISLLYTINEDGIKLLKAICDKLETKLFDSEEANFITLDTA